eukprot:5176581-Amphidinium_carterae.1
MPMMIATLGGGCGRQRLMMYASGTMKSYSHVSWWYHVDCHRQHWWTGMPQSQTGVCTRPPI